MGFGSFMIESQSPRWCYSTEEYNERRNNQPITIEAKKVPEWFYWTYCVDWEKPKL